ncbi:signal peptidase I [Candidatus Pacearchaeota archaeon]|nr:signal peptidase I [Candidatus Pacearchaeota archaeon]
MGVNPQSLQKRNIAIHDMIVEILSRGGKVKLSTIGTSMRPLIPAGSIVHVTGSQADNIRLGDVVLFGRESKYGKFLIHRVIKIRQGHDEVQIFTKGDSSTRDLNPLSAKDCLGKVNLIITESWEFNPDTWFWRVINIAIAYLSLFHTLFVDGYPFLKKKDLSRQIFPQRFSISLIKRLVYLGKCLSKQKPLEARVV